MICFYTIILFITLYCLLFKDAIYAIYSLHSTDKAVGLSLTIILIIS